MKISWNNTGDSLDIELYHPDLMSYWRSEVIANTDNEDECVLEECVYSERIVENAKCLLDAVNKINDLFLDKLQLDVFNYTEFKLDQRFLCELHTTWKKVQVNNPILIAFLKSQGGDWINTFYDINTRFHELEGTFRLYYSAVKVSGNKTEQIPTPKNVMENIHNYTKNGVFQVYLPYRSLGRADFDAWEHSDDINLSQPVINNFTSLPYGLSFNIRRPYITPYPDKYIADMRKYGRNDIVGEYMPVGFFHGYENNVKDLYDIFHRNIIQPQKLIIGEV